MKNFFVFLVGALIGAAIVYFVCCKPIVPSEETMVEAPKGTITPAQITVLDEAFNSRHQLISDSIVKRSDNRSSWYSLTDVRAYLTSAEQQADSLGYKMDGVRLYLGAHPGTRTQAGYTTMFFVPTGNLANDAEGNMSFLNFNFQPTHPDIPGGNGLNGGGNGMPPGSNYPQ